MGRTFLPILLPAQFTSGLAEALSLRTRFDPNQGPGGGQVSISSSTHHEEEKLMSPYLMQPFVIGPVIVGLLFAVTLLFVSVTDARD